MAKDSYEAIKLGSKELYVLDKPMKNETGSILTYPFGYEPTLHRYRLDYPEKLKMGNNIFVGAMASFALTRLNIKHRIGIFVFFLIGMMLPMQTALVPINIIYSKLNLLNTYFGLFYVYIGFGISYCILIMRGFMLGIPKDIDEAACIDGCNKWQLFYKIILPIAKPAIATLFITDFLSTWNEYLLASVIINDNAMKTVPVGIMTFVGEHGTDYGYLCAGVLVSVIPVMVVYLIFQRYLIDGMTSGAVKG